MKQQLILILLFSWSIFSLAQNTINNMIANNENAIAYTDDNGITVETRVYIESENDKTKIVFWQETNNGFFFNQTNWDGKVLLQLDNGEQITLIDHNMNGHHKQNGAYISGYFVPDLYQRYSSYYLTDLECQKLKENNLVRVTYHLDDEYDTREQVMDFGKDQLSLRSQFINIDK